MYKKPFEIEKEELTCRWVHIIFHVDNNLFSLSHKGLYLKTYLMLHKECPPWKWVGVALQRFDFDKQISNNIPAFDFSCVLLIYLVKCPVLKTSPYWFFFNQTASNNSHAVLGITLGKVINVLFFLRNPGFPSSTTDLTTCNYNVQKAIEGMNF